MLTRPFFSERAVEAKIYSRTDIISDPRLQRAKRGNNSARSSEQQDMQGAGKAFDTQDYIVIYAGIESHVRKYNNFFPPPSSGKERQ